MNQKLFSVCIPVRNDPNNLRRCLSGFAKQDMSDCEIIVCDDGSTPPLSPAMFEDIGVQFTLISQRGQGPSVARNHLARVAEGKFLFFVDADTVPRFDMIEQARKIVAKNPHLGVFYGSYDDAPEYPTLISTYRNLLHHYTHHQSATEGETVTTFWCGCGVIRRDLYLDFGGLSELYSKPSIEDIELGARLSAQGVPIKIFPQLQVKHLKRWNLKNWLLTDLFLRGIPWVRLMRATKHWASQLNFSWSQRVASLGAVMFVLLMPFTIVDPMFAFWAFISFAFFLVPNWPLFSLIRKKRGAGQALAVIPLHLIYALICVTAVMAAFLYPPLKLPPTPRLQPIRER